MNTDEGRGRRGRLEVGVVSPYAHARLSHHTFKVKRAQHIELAWIATDV
jgi:hypothetical protein